MGWCGLDWSGSDYWVISHILSQFLSLAEPGIQAELFTRAVALAHASATRARMLKGAMFAVTCLHLEYWSS
jgi:hypothetical protein